MNEKGNRGLPVALQLRQLRQVVQNDGDSLTIAEPSPQAQAFLIQAPGFGELSSALGEGAQIAERLSLAPDVARGAAVPESFSTEPPFLIEVSAFRREQSKIVQHFTAQRGVGLSHQMKALLEQLKVMIGAYLGLACALAALFASVPALKE